VPNITFIATANAVALAGAEPILIEVDPKTLCLDPKNLRRVHQTSPLSAVIPVHVSGRSALTLEMVTTLEELKITFVEDAAEALASKDPYSGKFLGTIGSAGAFSFSPNKVVTSGQGGLVVTNDDKIAEMIRELKDHGRPTRGTGGDDIHYSLGFNFKYTDIQAALLKSQLRKINSRILHLKSVYEHYHNSLSSEISLLEFDIKNGELPLWPEIRVADRPKMERLLTNHGIGYRKIWHPLSTQVPYKSQDKNFETSKMISREILWLPSSFSLTPKKLEKVVRVLNLYKDSE
jgi:perosamine synthetase